MQRWIVSLIVVPLFTGCWALPGGIDWDTSFDSLSGGDGGESGLTAAEPEPTGGEACVPATLPASASRYSPWRMASSPDGMLYVAGAVDLPATMLPGCDQPLKGSGGFVAAFAPDGTCAMISQLPGGEFFDVAVDGDQIVAAGRIGSDEESDAYLAILDTGLAPMFADTLESGTRADAVAALGGGRWGVVGRCAEGEGSLYAEYTPGKAPVAECHPVDNASEGSSIVVDIPGDTVYLAGRYTHEKDISTGEGLNANHAWLKSLPLDPLLTPAQRLVHPAAKERRFDAGVSTGPRLAIAGERLVIADLSRGIPPSFPAEDVAGDCKAVIGWLPKHPDLAGEAKAIWLNPDGDSCGLWIHDMVADEEEALITWSTATSFWIISGDPSVFDEAPWKGRSFAGRLNPETRTLTYVPNPLKVGDKSTHAVIHRHCDGVAGVAYRTGLGVDHYETKDPYEVTETMWFWAPPL